MSDEKEKEVDEIVKELGELGAKLVCDILTLVFSGLFFLGIIWVGINIEEVWSFTLFLGSHFPQILKGFAIGFAVLIAVVFLTGQFIRLLNFERDRTD